MMPAGSSAPAACGDGAAALGCANTLACDGVLACAGTVGCAGALGFAKTSGCAPASGVRLEGARSRVTVEPCCEPFWERRVAPSRDIAAESRAKTYEQSLNKQQKRRFGLEPLFGTPLAMSALAGRLLSRDET